MSRKATGHPQLNIGITKGGEDMSEAIKTMKKYAKSIWFPVGEPNVGFTQYFIGQS